MTLPPRFEGPTLNRGESFAHSTGGGGNRGDSVGPPMLGSAIMEVLVRKVLPLFPLLLVSLVLPGCPNRSTDETTVIMEMEPIFIVAARKDGKDEVGDYDSQQLFEKAQGDYESGRIRQALDSFQLLSRELQDKDDRALVMTNIALCHLGLKNAATALTVLDEAEELADTELVAWRIATVRMQALARVGRWDDLVTVGAPLLSPDIPGSVRSQAMLMVGMAHKAKGDLVQALKLLEGSSDVFLSEVPFEQHDKNRGLAKTFNKTGDIYKTLMENMKLSLPEERMALEVQDRLALYNRAQKAYHDALRVKDPYWSSRAAYRLGRLREEYAMGLLRAQRPTDLTQEEAAEMDAGIARLATEYLDSAVGIYEEALMVFERLGGADKWARWTKKRMAIIEQVKQKLARGE